MPGCAPLCSTCRNNDKYPKYVRKLLAIQAYGDFCVLATRVSMRLTYEADLGSSWSGFVPGRPAALPDLGQGGWRLPTRMACTASSRSCCCT